MLTACQSRFLDHSRQQPSTSIDPPKDTYVFSSAVWLSDEIIVFALDDSDRTMPNPFLIYNMGSQTWERLNVSSNPNCQAAGFGFLERLPNGNVGYVNTCIANGLETRTIDEINISSGQIQTLLDSGLIRVAGKFAFSPDMTELVQEDMISRFLSNKVFYRKDDRLVQIAPNFLRAMYPDWSPHERQIAFWGTESYPGGNPKDFTTLPEILDLSSYPWDLFISTPEGDNIVKVFSSVADPMLIRWSPTERKIAFSGIIDDAPGVFILDLKTSEVTRVWSRSADFDWSPAGTEIIVLNSEKDKDGNIKKQDINILELR